MKNFTETKNADRKFYMN